MFNILTFCSLQEKQHQEFMSSVENFSADGLKHVETIKETTEPAVIVTDEDNAEQRLRSSSGESSGSGSAKTKESTDSWEKVENQ